MPNNPVITPVDGSGNVLGGSGPGTAPLVTTSSPATPTVGYSEAATARTASGSTNTLTFPTGASQVFVGVNVTAASGTTPTLTVSLQQQDANGVWQTLFTTTSITAVGVSNFSVGTGLTNGAMIVGGGSYRLAWTIGGTTPSFTLQLSAQVR